MMRRIKDFVRSAIESFSIDQEKKRRLSCLLLNKEEI